MSDLLRLNPGLATPRIGEKLDLPCYPWGDPTRMQTYFGGDVAMGHFAGGNQQPGPEGLAGAAAAGAVVANVPGRPLPPGPGYQGSRGPGGQLVQPLYWFVDLLAPFQVGRGSTCMSGGKCVSVSCLRGCRGAEPAHVRSACTCHRCLACC